MMVDIDIPVWEGMFFQLKIIEMVRNIIKTGCMEEDDCEIFYKMVDDVILDKCGEMAKLYLDNHDSSSVNMRCGRNLLSSCKKGLEIGKFLDGEDLYNLGERFIEEYEQVHHQVIYCKDEMEFMFEKSDDYDDYDDYEDECPGSILWNFLLERGIEIYQGEEPYSLYSYRGTIYEITLSEGFLYEALKMDNIKYREKLFILYYLERVIYQMYGLFTVAITPVIDEKIKLLVVQIDSWYDSERALYDKAYTLPLLMLMKKYIETNIIKALSN